MHPAAGKRYDPGRLPFSEVAAFCGLANPDSFWRTLIALGIQPLRKRAFPDHHRYKVAELRDLLSAPAVLTTEKDAVNLPEIPPNLCWLQIGVKLDDEPGFFAELARQTGRPQES